MSLAYDIIQIIFAISAILVIRYDYKYQKIPFWLVIVNYITISILTNYWLLFGLLYLILCKIKDIPIDLLYILIMVYLIIIEPINYYSIICVLICLIYVLISHKSEKISFMVPLEISITIMLLTKG